MTECAAEKDAFAEDTFSKPLQVPTPKKCTCVQIMAILEGWASLTMIIYEPLTAAPSRAKSVLNVSCSPWRLASMF